MRITVSREGVGGFCLACFYNRRVRRVWGREDEVNGGRAGADGFNG